MLSNSGGIIEEADSTALPISAPWKGGTSMQGKTKEAWRHVCEQAAIEHDPDKLMELVSQINRMLEEKENRLQGSQKEQGG
jgi:UDP-N-acetylglucosamine 2-epimerase